MMPMRKIYNTGANVTFCSDWTVNELNPLYAIANSVHRRNANGLPNEAAIKAATLSDAIALNLENITGSIEVGKSADFVALDRDKTRANASSIERAEVLATILRGKVVYRGNK